MPRGAKKPLVSIVTPSLNQGEFIEATIQSVLGQDYRPIEYLVVDGGSTDSTLHILERYRDRVPFMSEPDRGKAEAIQKGFSLTSGEIVAWINSDDTYMPGAVSKAVDVLMNSPHCIGVYGGIDFIDRAGVRLHTWLSDEFSRFRIARLSYIPQQSCFVRRSAIEEFGGPDLSFEIAVDYELWLRLTVREPMVRIPHALASWRLYDEIGSLKQRRAQTEAMIRAASLHFSRVSHTWFLLYAQILLHDLSTVRGFFTPHSWSRADYNLAQDIRLTYSQREPEETWRLADQLAEQNVGKFGPPECCPHHFLATPKPGR